MSEFGISFEKLEDYIVYASVNLSQLIKETIKRTIKQVARKCGCYDDIVYPFVYSMGIISKSANK